MSRTIEIQRWVAASRLQAFRAEIAKWNVQAEKLGLESTTSEILEEDLAHPFYVPRCGATEGGDSIIHRRAFLIKVIGVEPVLDGWALAAVVDHTVTDEANFLRTVPGREIDASEYRKAEASRCDHCGYVRHRNKTFVLQHDERGEEVRVGSTCLKDFLPTTSPEALLDRASDLFRFLSDAPVGPELEPSPHGPIGWDTDEFLAEVARVIREDGWVSRGAAYADARLQASADVAASALAARQNPYVSSTDRPPAPNDEDVETATSALEWARALPVDAGNDYLDNLAVACRSHLTTWDLTGIVASAIVAYRRAIGHTHRQEAREEQKATSTHVGEKGERLELELDVVFTRVCAGYYGDSQLTKMVDADGNVFVWFASGQHWPDEGTRISLRGTVKDHDEYQGVAQTILSRCHIQEEVKV